MKSYVYVETSVISYLSNCPALDVITAGHQATTYPWWEQQRSNYDLVISQLIVKEASAGDPIAAARRLATRDGIPLPDANRPEAESFAEALIVSGALPMKALVDAAHIAVCAVADVEILLTWNLKHIASGFMIKKIQSVCTENGFDGPQLVTPWQLLGADYVD